MAVFNVDKPWIGMFNLLLFAELIIFIPALIKLALFYRLWNNLYIWPEGWPSGRRRGI
jgi:hypothetical protein